MQTGAFFALKQYTMKRIRTIAAVVLVVGFMASVSSCRSAKGCNCPTWEKQATPHK